MGFDGSGKIWMSGKLVDWNDATVHVGSHVLHYGSSIFEGIRMYDTPKGSAIFRLKEHIQRLFNSAKIYRMEIPYTFDQILDACLETLKANGDHDAYLRPIVYRGYKALAVDPRPCPVEVSIMTWRWGKYLGDDALEKGVDVCVSTWTRMAPNTFPALAKCGANYMNSQLIKQEAIANGYVEGIALDATGYVSEGSGENLFVVWDDKLLTPPLGNSVLPGITRDTIIKLARDMGIEVVEQMIPREMLYIAQEVFFTGSAAEVSPIRSVDKIVVGEGKRGPITQKLQERYFEVINGECEDKYNWLTPVKFQD